MILNGRLDRILSNLGFTSHRKCPQYISINKVRVNGKPCKPSDKVSVYDVTINTKPIPYPETLHILLHKPRGYVCSRVREGETKIIYDLLPSSFLKRNPPLVSAGRLDKWASGALVMSQDGDIIQRLTSPKRKSGIMSKEYIVNLQRPIMGKEAEIFESGELMLRSEETPLKPALFEVLNEQERLVRITLYEGRYHQIRRMLACVGNRAVTIKRTRTGVIELGDLPSGSWRVLTPEEIQLIITSPDSTIPQA